MIILLRLDLNINCSFCNESVASTISVTINFRQNLITTMIAKGSYKFFTDRKDDGFSPFAEHLMIASA